MAINSCSSTTNLATQYAEQLLKTTPLERPRQDKQDPNAPNQTPLAVQAQGPTVNSQGEVVGRLVNTTA